MIEQLGTAAAAAALFAGTDVDDLIVLTLLFLSARATGRPRPWHIWVGQYTGIAVLVAVSALAAVGLAVVPDRWVGLLGLIPFAMGVRGLVAAARARAGEEPPPLAAGPVAAGPVAAGPVAVAGITIANGADNIAVYTPLFRTIGLAGTVATIAVFAVMVAVWCAAASWLGSHRAVVAVVDRAGHWVVPVVFIILGLAIIATSL